jgi:hypothetical protein
MNLENDLRQALAMIATLQGEVSGLNVCITALFSSMTEAQREAFSKQYLPLVEWTRAQHLGNAVPDKLLAGFEQISASIEKTTSPSFPPSAA